MTAASQRPYSEKSEGREAPVYESGPSGSTTDEPDFSKPDAEPCLKLATFNQETGKVDAKMLNS